ncbi:MAG: hypothetical protein D6732_03370 [Methanobacteriota archaeon]|nr:MAG: hypothetical protein D6732_03370 [Euryarchaeota archaeon]
MKRYLVISVLFGLLLLLTAVSPLNAQAIWTHHTMDRGVALEALKPTFTDNEGVEFSTSALYLSAHTTIGKGFWIIGELPVVHYGFSPTQDQQNEQEISETAVANAYFGFQYQTTGREFMADVGVRLPFLSEEKEIASQSGLYSDLERWDAFVPHALTFSGLGRYQHRFDNGFYAGVRGGAAYQINTEKDAGEDRANFYLLYGINAGYAMERLDFNADLIGRFLTTNEEGGFGENTMHLATLSANYRVGKVQPGLLVKLPLDKDLTDVIDYVVGLQFAVNLR